MKVSFIPLFLPNPGSVVRFSYNERDIRINVRCCAIPAFERVTETVLRGLPIPSCELIVPACVSVGRGDLVYESIQDISY